MTRLSREYYRARALERRRSPDQDAKNANAADAIRRRIEALLVGSPLIQQLNAAAAQRSNVSES